MLTRSFVKSAQILNPHKHLNFNGFVLEVISLSLGYLWFIVIQPVCVAGTGYLFIIIIIIIIIIIFTPLACHARPLNPPPPPALNRHLICIMRKKTSRLEFRSTFEVSQAIKRRIPPLSL